MALGEGTGSSEGSSYRRWWVWVLAAIAALVTLGIIRWLRNKKE